MMRLDRLLATLGMGSRTEVKSLIRSGRVSLDGTALTNPASQIHPDDVLCLDGQIFETATDHHLMMNKPKGLLTAARDARQDTVMNLLEARYISCHCMPVGRLDKDTEGLLLFTTNGQAAHRLLSPKNKIKKVYEVRVAGRLENGIISRFKAGVHLSDFRALPADLLIHSANDVESQALVTVYEGKYHQIKRMFGACGHEVLHLKRLEFAALRLDESLAPGQYRPLSDSEWQTLLRECAIEL